MKPFLQYTLLFSLALCVNFNAKAQTDSTFEIVGSADNYVPCLNDIVQLNSVFNVSPYYNAYSSCGTNGSLCTSGSIERTFSSGAVAILADFCGPFESSSSKYQYIYTASELQAKGIFSGAFNSLSFDVDWNNISGNINDMTVYMNCTATSSFSSSGNNTFLPEGDVVYSTTTFTTSTGWNSISFDNTFDWDGVSNIVITVCHSGSSFASNMGIECTDINVYRTLGKNGSCATATPTFANQFRPNMKLGICNPIIDTLTYVWTPSTGLSDPTSPNPTFVATSTPQSYVVSVTDGVHTRYDTVDIGVGIVPTAVTSSDTTICEGENVLINATGGSTYTWSHGLGNGQSHNVSPNTTTTYEVIVASVDGCTDTNDVTITVNPAPMVSITLGTNELIANSGYVDYTWYLDGNEIASGTSNTYTDIELLNGDYTVEVTDDNGCKNTSDVYTYALNSIGSENSSTTLYPNPFNNTITVSSSEINPNSSVRITDLSGKVHPVKYTYSNETIQIDGRSLPGGIYILEMDRIGKMKIVKY